MIGRGRNDRNHLKLRKKAKRGPNEQNHLKMKERRLTIAMIEIIKN